MAEFFSVGGERLTEADARRVGAARSTIDHRGGGGNDGGMEARVAKLEATAEHIQKDVAEIKGVLKDISNKLTAIHVAVATKVETSKHDSDFRITIGALIAAVLGLAGLMAKGFKWI